MESEGRRAEREDSFEEIPSLIKAIAAQNIAGFDDSANKELKISILDDDEVPAQAMEKVGDDANKVHRTMSISMPSSPVEASTIKVFFRDDAGAVLGKDLTTNSAAKFYSQPMPANPATNKLKYQRFDSFKTWSGKLERQISNLRGKHREIEEEEEEHQTDYQHAELDSLPVDRFFDALEGPELDTLRASEEIILPEDEKWPFLLRFPISTFGICLGMSSQAIMWKALSSSESTKFLKISPNINLVLWSISVAALLTVSSIYSLKIIFYFEAVRREYFHPVRVNFFFAPFVALLFLSAGVPPSLARSLHSSLWYVLMAPILCLELKIYGQWMSGGERRLSKVANPSNHLALVGNFAGALLGASMGLKEGPIFFFAVGLAHYAVLFVTLYQRLPTNVTLPKELHPVFFLFVAAPSTASMAWANIQGEFDYGSRIAYFIAVFLYCSLAVRVNFFRGFRFSIAWWAYTFPMTGAAIATIKYSSAVTTLVTKGLAVVLCSVATVAVGTLLVTTIVHGFVVKDLFPNDMAIAISGKRPKMTRRWYHHRRSSSLDGTTTLNSADSDSKDLEDCVADSRGSGKKDVAIRGPEAV